MVQGEEECYMPLNDVPVSKMKRSASRGSNSDIELEEDGAHDTLEYRIQAKCPKDGAKQISLWHDVSLVHIEPETEKETPYMNFVCEIPKFTRYDQPRSISRRRRSSI
jgi:inorganic pyrophosphatase